MCVLFYREDDLFNITHLKPTDIQLSTNKKLITNLKSTFTPIYGTIEIDSTINAIYEWNYKIVTCTSWIDFGISSWIAPSKFLRREGGYCFGLYSYMRDNCVQTFDSRSSRCIHTQVTDIINAIPLVDGDTISVCFDVGKQELKFCINGCKQPIIIKNITCANNIKYRALIVLSESQNSVEMTKFIKTDRTR